MKQLVALRKTSWVMEQKVKSSCNLWITRQLKGLIVWYSVTKNLLAAFAKMKSVGIIHATFTCGIEKDDARQGTVKMYVFLLYKIYAVVLPLELVALQFSLVNKV